MQDSAGLPGATAWGDESIRMHGSPPMYLMCATVFEAGAEDALARLAKAKPRGMHKLHWYDMSDREKARSLQALAEMPHWNAVAIASPLLSSIRPERGRRKCLERLLPALEERGVSALRLESRWRQEDRADIDMVVALRNRKLIGGIQVEHVAPGPAEPRLWVPDQVLGAIGDLLCGTGNPAAWGEAWNEIDRRDTLYPAALV